MSLKNNKFFRRLAVAMMAGAMMVSTLGMTVFAEDEVNVTPSNNEVTITKVLTSDNQNAMVPNTTFNFRVTPVDDGDEFLEENIDLDVNKNVVYEGVAGGAYFETNNNKVEYSPNDTFVVVNDETLLSKTTKVKLDVTKFSKPGIFRYLIEEVIPAEADKRDGITYDKNQYYMDLFVVRDENTNEFEVKYVTFVNVDSDKNSAKGTGEFFNNYATNDLTISKKVTGNQGDVNQLFHFGLNIFGQVGEQYKVVVYNADNTEKDNMPYYSEVDDDGVAKIDFDLKHGEYVTVYGLSESDKYVVMEQDYREEGYKTTIKVNGEEIKTVLAQGTTANGDVTVAFTNDKSSITPTGIVLSIMPYVLMVALAAVLGFTFLRKRKYDL